jgi:hypothetical protein
MYKDLRLPAKQAHQGSEDSLQILCAEWLKKALLRYSLPKELFWHVPSEGKRTVQFAMRLKAMGLRKGIPDVCLLLPRGGCHGFFCELKKAGEAPTKDQKELLNSLDRQNYYVIVVNDFETFKQEAQAYLEA